MLKAIVRILFRKQIRLRETHAALVSRLSLDEAVLAHNGIIYGHFQGVFPLNVHRGDYERASAKDAYQYIETATTLYEYIMRLEMTPITLKEKAAYRMGLTRAVCKILNDRTNDFGIRMACASDLLSPYALERARIALNDRSNLEQVVMEMNWAVN